MQIKAAGGAAGTPLRIGVIGAGLVGTGWILVFARAGTHVQVFDHCAQCRADLPARLQESLAQMADHGLITEPPAAILARITIADTLAGALSEASYVQESILEIREVKAALYLEMDSLLSPNTIIGSSTSGFPASVFTEGCSNRERFLVAHPVNPPHLIPAVELVPTPWTSPDALKKTRVLMEQVGQVPITVNRELPGFILNRLQGALLDEAWSLFRQGYASAEDIDRTVSFGLGLRWSFMGPFETIDLNAPGGIDDYARRLGPMYETLAIGREPAGAWSEDAILRATEERRGLLAAEDLARRRAWRDENLMALRAHQLAKKKEAG